MIETGLRWRLIIAASACLLVLPGCSSSPVNGGGVAPVTASCPIYDADSDPPRLSIQPDAQVQSDLRKLFPREVSCRTVCWYQTSKDGIEARFDASDNDTGQSCPNSVAFVFVRGESGWAFDREYEYITFGRSP